MVDLQTIKSSIFISHDHKQADAFSDGERKPSLIKTTDVNGALLFVLEG